jgi:EmrB/QacA subfamily drug resistance transporter
MLGGLAVAMSQGSLNVAIPSMMSSLSTNLDRIQWVQTGYGIIQAVMIPAVGWLGARLGTKRLFLLSIGIFITGSVLAGLAWDVNSLIFFRILQGVGGGPITPLGMSILYSAFPPDKRGLALGLYNFSHSFGPAIAPALGGYLIELFNWRAIFYLNVPVGLLSAGLVFLTMPQTQQQQRRPWDAVGVLSMASFLVLLLLALSEGRRYGWGAPMILTLFGIAGVSLLIFLSAELTRKMPFVDLRLHSNIPFTMGCLIGFLNTMEFRGTNFLLPIMLQRIFHYTPFQTGLFFLPPALVMGVTSILAGRLSDKIQPRLLLAVGLLVLTYVSFQFCTIDVWATTAVLLGLIILRRAAQAFCHSPLTTAALSTIPEEQIHMASGLFNLHRTLAGAVSVAVTATLLEHREEVHTSLLAERQALYPLGTAVATETIREVLIQDGHVNEGLEQMTTAVLRQKLGEEAALAGYQDLFFLFAALALLSLVPVLLLRSGKRSVARAGGTTGRQRRSKPSVRSPR